MNLTDKKKTDNKPKSVGNVKLIDGIAVVLPPEDEEEVVESTSETTLTQKGSTVTVEVESPEAVQHVHDESSEEKSRESVARNAEENKKRSDEASITLTPKKVGSSIVVDSESYDDLAAYIAEENKETEDSES